MQMTRVFDVAGKVQTLRKLNSAVVIGGISAAVQNIVELTVETPLTRSFTDEAYFLVALVRRPDYRIIMELCEKLHECSAKRS